MSWVVPLLENGTVRSSVKGTISEIDNDPHAGFFGAASGLFVDDNMLGLPTCESRTMHELWPGLSAYNRSEDSHFFEQSRSEPDRVRRVGERRWHTLVDSAPSVTLSDKDDQELVIVITAEPGARAQCQVSSMASSGLVEFTAPDVRHDLDMLWIFPSKNYTHEASFDQLARLTTKVRLEQLLFAAKEERFEPGMETHFSRGLQELHSQGNEALLRLIELKLSEERKNSEVLSAVLEWVSHQEKPTSFHTIIRILASGLHNDSPLVRDAAALAFAYFDPKTARNYIRDAIDRETVKELKSDLCELFASLE